MITCRVASPETHLILSSVPPLSHPMAAAQLKEFTLEEVAQVRQSIGLGIISAETVGEL